MGRPSRTRSVLEWCVVARPDDINTWHPYVGVPLLIILAVIFWLVQR